MRRFFMIAQALFLAVLVSFFVFLPQDIGWIWGLWIFAFVLLNITCGLFTSGSTKGKLRTLQHGVTALFGFVLALVCAVSVFVLLLTKTIETGRENALLFHAISATIGCFLVFWNGMLSVYLSSKQLGIRFRVLGVVCGMLFPLNLVILGVILSVCERELATEIGKERLNRARKAEMICQTRYPILLVHGVFFRDNEKLNYWGRIPAELEQNGATIYYGNHRSAGSIAVCGEEIAARVRQICAQTGCEKINIIAHSKGGLDSRFAIANCGISGKVASITTINTPHRGCLFADWLLAKAPQGLKQSVAMTYNGAARLIGDKEPDFLLAVSDLTHERASNADATLALPEGIFAQSVGSVMRRAGSGRFPLNLSHSFVAGFDGRNDGLVGEGSFAFGERFTLLDLPVKRGISHADMIDLNRENIEGFDVREFYVQLVADLKKRGF